MVVGQVEEGVVMESEQRRGKALVHVLAFVLDRMVQTNQKSSSASYAGRPPHLSPPSTTTTKFHALRPPSINIRDYLLRILKYASCSPECFVLALIYIDRFIQRNGFKLTACNVHRVLITSVVLAAKFFDDQYFNNAYYAKVGGVPCSEMNALELDFLFMINFSLHVTSDVYTKYYNELANHIVFTNALISYKNNNYVEHSASNTSTTTTAYHYAQVGEYGGHDDLLMKQQKRLSSPSSVRHFIARDPMRDNQLTYYTHDNYSPPNEDDQQSQNVVVKQSSGSGLAFGKTNSCTGNEKQRHLPLGVNA